MNQDPYEFDAQARQSKVSRDRTAKNRNIQKNHPSSLPKTDFTFYRKVTQSRLECLTKGNYAQPVISLYLNIPPERTMRQKDALITVFNSLKHTSLHERKTYLDSLTHEQQQSLENDLIGLQQYLQEQVDTSDTKSLVMFKSNHALQWVFNLSLAGDDYLAIAPSPHIMPLLVQIDEQRTALVVHIGVDIAHIYLYQSGSMRLLNTIHSQVADLSLDAARPNKVQRHNYDLLHRHLRQVDDAMHRFSKRYDVSDTVVVGDERVRGIFQKNGLSNHIQQSIIASLPYLPGSTESDLARQVQHQLESNEVAEEGYYLDMINRENGNDGIVSGLDEVISAQNRHLIRSLLVDKQLKQPGYFCDNDRYIATTSDECPLCGNTMLSIDNVVDKLVELANHYQVDYKIIRQRQNELSKFGGIAGTMYEIQ